METGDFTALGAAEQLVADKFKEAVEQAHKNANKLAESYAELLDVDWEAVIIDSEKKDTVISVLENIEKVSGSLAFANLIPVLLKVIVKPKED